MTTSSLFFKFDSCHSGRGRECRALDRLCGVPILSGLLATERDVTTRVGWTLRVAALASRMQRV
jgi:hypothetical protein